MTMSPSNSCHLGIGRLAGCRKYVDALEGSAHETSAETPHLSLQQAMNPASADAEPKPQCATVERNGELGGMLS